MEKEKNKRKNLMYIIIFGILFLLVLLSATYAYFTANTSNTNSTLTINGSIDCLNITYSETNVINLSNKYPITDEYALANLTPVTVTVTNNCTNVQDKINYVLTYTSLSENSGYIPDNKVRMAANLKMNTAAEEELLAPDYVSNLESLTSGTTYNMLVADLANRQNVSTYTNKTNYVLDRNRIGSGETNIYKIYLWVDYYEGDTTHAGLNNNSTEGLDYKSALSLVVNSEKVIYPDITVELVNYNRTYNTQTPACTTNDNAYFNTKYQALVFNNVASEESKCTLTSSNSTYTNTVLNNTGSYPYYLKNKVESEATDETNNSIFDLSNYVVDPLIAASNFSYFSSSDGAEVTGTTGSYWQFNNGTFTSSPSTFDTSSRLYYHVYGSVPEPGYYQICYNISQAVAAQNRIYFYVDGNYKSSVVASKNEDISGCYSLGYLNSNQNFNISEYAYSYASSPTISFQIKKASKIAVNAGYRYEGTNPNNYIWFNNEMWRIIGVVPVCTSTNCTTNEELVKILRKDSIGSIAYDAKSSGYTGTWGNNTLYTLLNTKYWGKQNATDTETCYGYKNSSKTKCDYTTIGLSSSDYYGNMIRQNVYWNTGASTSDELATAVYVNETQEQTVQGTIGIINASDYGYGSSESTRGNLSQYGNTEITLANWLYTFYKEFTMTQYTTDRVALYIDYQGGLSSSSSNYAYDGFSVRPVVYLKSSVYVVSGNGTEANPYQIAM